MPSHSAPAIGTERLAFLDGVRGLAALYVVAYHAWGEAAWSDAGSASIMHSPLLHWLQYGHLAVVVFIVVSGYSLMLPVVRKGGVGGGWWAYFRRRAWRILPTYYAALALSLALTLGVPGMNSKQGMWWDYTLPAFSAGTLLSHLLLIHNLRPEWIFKINTPMWSIATEWQIYFVFPLLVWVWRRLGLWAALATGMILGVAATRIGGPNLWPACPWFIGLFAMGMAAASLSFHTTVVRPSVWGMLAVLIFIGVVLLNARDPSGRHALWIDSATGLAAASLLVFLARGPDRRVTQWLGGVEGLGIFSYSLYLVHPLPLTLMHRLLIRLHVTPEFLLATLLTAGVAMSLAIAYLFHLWFERPFMRVPANTGRTRERVASERSLPIASASASSAAM